MFWPFWLSQHIQCLHLMYAEVAWVLLSFRTQVQLQIILDSDYLPYRNNIYRKPIHYYDCILISHSQPQLIFHFQLMWEVFFKNLKRGIAEVFKNWKLCNETLSACLIEKQKIPGQLHLVKHEKSGSYALLFQQFHSSFQMFL